MEGRRSRIHWKVKRKLGSVLFHIITVDDSSGFMALAFCGLLPLERRDVYWDEEEDESDES